MPKNTPPFTDADYYGFFMTGLFGLLDDAEMSGYSPEATALLRAAQEMFWQDFRSRHPNAWTDGDRETQ